MSILSDNLRKARKAIPDLSQDRAAKMLKIKRQRLGAWEEGRSAPPLSKLPEIIELYQITDWVGFILSEKFDPRKQDATKFRTISAIEERYKKLPKKLRDVADVLLSLA